MGKGGLHIAQIRAVAVADIPVLIRLMQGYIVDFYQQSDPGVDRLESFIRHLVDQPDQGYQLVAEQDGIVVGFATLYFIWSTLKLKSVSSS